MYTTSGDTQQSFYSLTIKNIFYIHVTKKLIAGRSFIKMTTVSEKIHGFNYKPEHIPKVQTLPVLSDKIIMTPGVYRGVNITEKDIKKFHKRGCYTTPESLLKWLTIADFYSFSENIITEYPEIYNPVYMLYHEFMKFWSNPINALIIRSLRNLMHGFDISTISGVNDNIFMSFYQKRFNGTTPGVTSDDYITELFEKYKNATDHQQKKNYLNEIKNHKIFPDIVHKQIPDLKSIKTLIQNYKIGNKIISYLILIPEYTYEFLQDRELYMFLCNMDMEFHAFVMKVIFMLELSYFYKKSVMFPGVKLSVLHSDVFSGKDWKNIMELFYPEKCYDYLGNPSTFERGSLNDLSTIRSNLNVITGGLLDLFEFSDNIVICGSIIPCSAINNGDFNQIYKLYNATPGKAFDIDIACEYPEEDYIKESEKLYNAVLKIDPGATIEKVTSVMQYKYYIKYNCSGESRVIDFFRVTSIQKMIARFHLSCVRAYWNGSDLIMLPSFYIAAHTLINFDGIRWASSSSSPIDVVRKYLSRGFGFDGTFDNLLKICPANPARRVFYVGKHHRWRFGTVVRRFKFNNLE